jgi:hypothetical protein
VNTIESNDKESNFGITTSMGACRTEASSGCFNSGFERLDRPFECSRHVHSGGRYRFNEVAFDYNRSTRCCSSTRLAKGQFYDGNLLNYGVQAGFRPSAKLSWVGTYTKNKIELPYGNFDTDLIGLRFNWSFTPKSYLQAFSQYNSVSRQITHNIRFALLSTSSTGLFVVYNTAQSSYEFNDPHGVDRRLLSQALIIKFNHLLNF